MRRAKLLFLLAMPAVFAAYQYSYFDAFATTTLDSLKWFQNGTVSSVPGLYVSGAGGAVISKEFAASTEHEVKVKLNLTTSGGTYNIMLRASDNAQPGFTATGSFYSVELHDPVLTPTSCSATLLMRKFINGTWTNFSVDSVWCRPQMEIRAVMLSTGQILVFFDNYFQKTVTDTEIPSGRPGIGGYWYPAGNTVSRIDMGPIDHTAPWPVEAPSVGVSSSPNYVDLQWRGAADDTNGIGVWRYYVLRENVIIGESSSAAFTDAAVTPGAQYNYKIRACDYHKNCATDTTVPIVTVPPAGAVDARQVGVRPTGTYWGGLGEQIDVRSGNLNFSIPLVKAVGRGGWGVTFALSYNSQLWRRDNNQTWKLGKDIGYGFGWMLQAGSLQPVYNGLWSVDHYVFMDSSGAEYRLNVNTNGVWTSKESIYVSYDSTNRRLYFRDGSFWQMDARSAGGFEDDMGTLYPSTMQDTNGAGLS